MIKYAREVTVIQAVLKLCKKITQIDGLGVALNKAGGAGSAPGKLTEVCEPSALGCAHCPDAVNTDGGII